MICTEDAPVLTAQRRPVQCGAFIKKGDVRNPMTEIWAQKCAYRFAQAK